MSSALADIARSQQLGGGADCEGVCSECLLRETSVRGRYSCSTIIKQWRYAVQVVYEGAGAVRTAMRLLWLIVFETADLILANVSEFLSFDSD